MFKSSLICRGKSIEAAALIFSAHSKDLARAGINHTSPTSIEFRSRSNFTKLGVKYNDELFKPVAGALTHDLIGTGFGFDEDKIFRLQTKNPIDPILTYHPPTYVCQRIYYAFKNSKYFKDIIPKDRYTSHHPIDLLPNEISDLLIMRTGYKRASLSLTGSDREEALEQVKRLTHTLNIISKTNFGRRSLEKIMLGHTFTVQDKLLAFESDGAKVVEIVYQQRLELDQQKVSQIVVDLAKFLAPCHPVDLNKVIPEAVAQANLRKHLSRHTLSDEELLEEFKLRYGKSNVSTNSRDYLNDMVRKGEVDGYGRDIGE